MEANKILQADILDIIFDGKNKEYGAYELRKSYRKRLTRSLFIMGALMLLVFLGSVLANVVAPDDDGKIEVADVEMAEVKTEEPVVVPPPPPPIPPPPPEIKQVEFVPPKVVEDEKVKPDEIIEDIEEDAAISDVTVKTDNTVQIVQAPVVDEGSKVVEVPKVVDDEGKIFTKVEVEAGFPGGEAAWRKYLSRNLNDAAATDNGAPPGTYRVIVKFIVSKDGTISDVQAETNFGFGMEAESIRAIKKGPNWTPALQNGRNVNAIRRQPIVWVVNE